MGGPGMARPPMGPPAASNQFAGWPGPHAWQIAEARMNAARDRQAAAAKMRDEFAKRAEAIRRKAAQADKTADHEKAAKAKRSAGEKSRAAQAAKKKKAQAEKALEKE